MRLDSEYINLNINPTKEGEATHSQGADHTGMQIGVGTNSYRFYTDDSDQVFFTYISGDDTTGDGSRGNPYKTLVKALGDVDGVTKFCATCLDSWTGYTTNISKPVQVDPGQTPTWGGTLINDKFSGFKIKLDVTITTPNNTDQVINCTFNATLATPPKTITHTKGVVEKCQIIQYTHNYDTTSGASDILDCEYVEHTDCIINIQNSAPIIENTIFYKLTADANVISDLIFLQCTGINESERLINLGSQTSFSGLKIENTLFIDKSGNNMFDTNEPELIDLDDSLLVTDSDKYAFQYTSPGVEEFLGNNVTFVTNIEIDYDNESDLGKILMNNIIIEGNFEITWSGGSPNTSKVTLESGNQRETFNFSNDTLIKRGGQWFDIDPKFSDPDNNEYFLAYRPKNDEDSGLIGRSFRFQIVGGFQDRGYDMGAFWNADYSGLLDKFQNSLQLPKPAGSNQIRYQQITEFAKQKIVTGEITIYYDEETREEIVSVNYEGLESIYEPVVEKLRENNDTICQLSLNLDPASKDTVTIDGNQSAGALFLEIVEANIIPGTKLIINEVQYLILWTYDFWITSTKLVLDKPLQDNVSDTQVINTIIPVYGDYKYIPENINKDYETGWAADTRNNLVLQFTRRKP